MTHEHTDRDLPARSRRGGTASRRSRAWATLALAGLLLLPASRAHALIAFVKNVGTGGSITTDTAGETIVVPAAGVAAGNTVLIAFVMDPASGLVGATDTRGNVYTNDADVQRGTSGSMTGVREVILSARLRTALTAGDLIVVTHPNVVARAIAVSEFSGLAATAMIDRTSTGTGNSTTPTSGNTATTQQADELVFGAIGVESNTLESFTPGTTFTPLTRASSGTTGLVTDNVSSNPEFRIATATGLYSATGSLPASRRWAAAVATYRGASCGNGAIEPGEQCDDGNTTNGDCCSSTCQFESAGTVCRAAAGGCDVAETCTGTSGACPADTRVGAGTPCPDDGNVCTIDLCDGVSVACQHPAGNAGTVCRPSAGICDPQEICTGTTTACPADARTAANTPCPDDGNVCTRDVCDGTSAACTHPAGNAGTVCRASAGDCDPQEVCTGTSTSCPADARSPANSPCTDDGNVCTRNVCDGTSVACTHPAASAGIVCRASTGDCDPQELCSGSSTICPPDVRSPAGTACTSDNNPCTLDQCDGTNAACQHPAGNGGAVCRAAAGACDAAETCTGTSATCPADAKSTAVCRPAAGPCDVAETCDGVANACPPDAFVAATQVCRAAAGPCDLAESCTGTSAPCPPDRFSPATTVCRGSAGACDPAETCTGSAAACPPDALSVAGAVCRPLAGLCDVAEVCDGSSVDCPADVLLPTGTQCRAAAGPCDLAAECTGGSPVCPPDEKSTALCRPSAGPCDVPERCDGVGNDCPMDRLVAAGVPCRLAVDQCDAAEVCTGTSASCPPDLLQPDGTLCDDSDRCTIGDVCRVGICAGTDPGLDCPDSFVCYKARNTSPFPSVSAVHLVDDFEDRFFDVLRPRGLCMPADANATLMVGPDRRLDGYAMRAAEGLATRQSNLKIVNAIGELVLNTGTPDVLRVPGTPSSPTGDPNPYVDHYKCYKTFVTPGTPRLRRGVQVAVRDEFAATARALVLKKPGHLCVPANDDSQGVRDPSIVLLCYKANPAPGQARALPQLGLQLTDEFGAQTLNTVKELEVCVPSVRMP